MNNLRQIGIAFHNYHDEHGRFPLSAIYAADGRPLLSWRVLLLPYFEDANARSLHGRFRLDEPWDSPHNLKLLADMPSVYRRPVAKKSSDDKHSTIYQVFVGPGTVFEGPEGLSLHAITDADGTGMTLLVVEAGEPVPWTKPVDLPYASDRPLPPLGGLFRGEFRPFSSEHRISVFSALFADGHVQALPLPAGREELIRGLITWNGREPVQLP